MCAEHCHRARALITGEVTEAAIAKHLGLDKSTAHRRVAVAERHGHLLNRETIPYRPAPIVLGEPLPAGDSDVLPSVAAVVAAVGVGESYSGEPAGTATSATLQPPAGLHSGSVSMQPE